ncbi:MAG: hypothetical protein Q8Q44_21910 [Nocardioides sp.]|nr:hypothetical protein [Nocardioides sp.]
MALPVELTAKVYSAFLDTGFRLFNDYLGTVRIRKPVSPPEQKQGCNTCMIHQHVVLARGYVEGIYSRLNKDGSVPAGLGGTIPQARQHIKEAMMEIPSVMGTHPMIDVACKQLGEILPDVYARLENVQSKEEWELILGKLKLAENAAYSIPEAIYRREYPKPEDTTETIVLLKPEEKEVLSLIGQAKRGEIPASEARAKLAKILLPGE